MQVAHVFLEMPIGGAEDLVVDLLGCNHGITHHALCIKSSGDMGTELITGKNPYFHSAPWIKGKRFSPLVAYRLSQWLKTNQIDLIHSHVYNAHVYAALAARLAGIPHLMHHHKTWTGLRKRREWILSLISRCAIHHITLSEKTREDIHQAFNLPLASISALPNPIDPGLFFPSPSRDTERQALGLDSRTFLIGNAASLRPQKNQRMLIDAYRTLGDPGRKSHLLILGEGPERTQLEGAAADRDDILLPGNQRPIAPWLRCLDLFVLPSTWEGQPLVLLQALAVGVPILASDIEGNRDLLGPDHPGYFQPDSSAELADLLRRALTESDWLEEIRRAQEPARQAIPNLAYYREALAQLYRRLEKLEVLTGEK